MIEAALFDIDGILTDGTVAIDSAGKETKRLCFDDIDAIFELKRAGIKVGFLSGESDNFTRYVRQRFSPDIFLDGCKDKLKAFKVLEQELKLDASRTAYVGDSRKDVELLNYVSFSFAPSDAVSMAQEVAKVVLRSKRGDGVIREMVDFFLDIDMKYTKTLAVGEDIKDVYWQKKIKEHIDVIKEMHSDRALLAQIEKIAEYIVNVYRSGHKLLICGNGGSAADAQHLAAELVGKFSVERAALDAEALTANVSSITALGNDYTYDIIFSRQVESRGKSGDVLIGLSTSGRSRNVILAMETARKKDMTTIGITCSDKNVEITRAANFCVHIPSKNTARIQEAYMLIGHLLCGYIETKLFGEGENGCISKISK